MSPEEIPGAAMESQGCNASPVQPARSLVQLRYATLPGFLRFVAVHYWFAVFDAGSQRWQRWEVWQTRNAGGRSLGYIHCDRRHPDCGVGGGAYRLAAEWEGGAARRICRVLANVDRYPYWNRYRAWPGPNSNTFVAWVIHQAGLGHRLDPRAIGKDYSGLIGVRRLAGPPGIQLETPLLGIRIRLCESVEVHVLGFTWGVRWSPLEVYTPGGRVGLWRGKQR